MVLIISKRVLRGAKCYIGRVKVHRKGFRSQKYLTGLGSGLVKWRVPGKNEPVPTTRKQTHLLSIIVEDFLTI